MPGFLPVPTFAAVSGTWRVPVPTAALPDIITRRLGSSASPSRRDQHFRSRDVGSVHLFQPRPSLGPDELHIASEAFDAALRAVVGPLAAIPPERVRDILAKYISERALMGERDPETLRDGALECLSLMAQASAS